MLLRDRTGEDLLGEGRGSDPAALAAHPLFAPLADARVEACALAYLDRAGRLLGHRLVEGSVGSVRVPVRLVAADALLLDAARVVIAHNHPGGDPRPSGADLAYTRHLQRGLEALEVVLFDHLVLAGGGFTSLRAAGLL